MKLTAKLIFVIHFIFDISHGIEKLYLGGHWQVTNSNKSIQVNATVPGGIYTDLEENNIIGNPLFRFNDVEYRWIGLDSWSYSRNFTVSSTFLNHVQINLLCEGLDTVGHIFINNNLVGNSNNMFVTYNFDVKKYLKEGENTIEIQFESPVKYASEQYGIYLWKNYSVPPICPAPVQHGECHMNFIRKIQSSFSWDWGPAFPSVGIWKNISLEAIDSLKLTDIIVNTNKNNKGWQIDLKIFFNSAIQQVSKNGVLQVLLDSKNIYDQTVNISFTNHKAVQNISCPDIGDIKEWWPNGYGDQPLYNLSITYTDKTSNDFISKSLKIGFRTIELIQEPITNATGLTFYFRINGQSVFLKGSNWIPAGSFPEKITTSYIRRLLKSAKDTNMNVLRVWGGGMYETDAFYEIADEFGILLWHDLMFACAMYPTSEVFLSFVIDEITQQIKRLQHHPSILLWSGNNENEVALVQDWYGTGSKFAIFKADYIKLYITIIKATVESLDTSRPFLASSPSNGIESEKEGWLAQDPQDELYGDVHFYIYTGDTWDWNAYPIPRFTSEFGFQSWSSFETLLNVTIAEDWFYDSNFSSHRQHHALGNNEMYSGILYHMRIPDEDNGNSTIRFKNLLYLTQIFQAMSLKTETEHYLRHQNILTSDGRGNTMGALYWQLNDIWQCPSWASIEYGGKWKMAHYFVNKFFAPQLISPLELDDGKLNVFLVTNPVIPEITLKLVLHVYQWKTFHSSHSVTLDFDAKQISSQKVYEDSIDELLQKGNCANRTYCFLYFQLYNGSKELSNNWLLLSNFVTAQGLKTPHLEVVVTGENSNNEGGSDFELQITSDAIAPFVWLEVFGIQGRFSDNGFLLVKPNTTIVFQSWENVTKTEIAQRLSINSLQNIY